MIYLSCFYFLLILSFSIGIFRLSIKYNNKPKKYSIIIAARNEAHHLPKLLDILANQNYPKNCYEIIIANDRSSDSSSKIVMEFQKNNSNLKLVEIKNESSKLIGKKNAINNAIKESKFDILAFIDADSIPTKNWLKEINIHFTDDTDFVAGYSELHYNNIFFSLLKNLERAAIFAVTAGSMGNKWALTCAAGNMAYRKSLFEKVNGFSNIGKIPSGDDDLLLQKMGKYINKMRFMFSPNSVVLTEGKTSFSEKINLETRRASKWKHYTLSAKLLTLFIFSYYLIFLKTLFFMMFGLLSFKIFLLILFLKILPEFLLLTIFLFKIKRTKLLILFPLAEIIYIPYFVFFGLKGTFGKYKWKE